jgi:hypothetical protein
MATLLSEVSRRGMLIVRVISVAVVLKSMGHVVEDAVAACRDFSCSAGLVVW